MESTDFIDLINAVGDTVAEALGGMDILLSSLLTVMVLDILTGVTVAVWLHASPKTKDGDFSRNVLFKGLFQKALILAIIALSVILDKVLGIAMVRDTMMLFYVLEEAVSVIENADRLGVRIPKKLKQVLKILESEIDGDDEEKKE